MARGDILLVDLPLPTNQPGHEQIGHRPAIVVQADIPDAKLPTTMIIPFSANLGALRFPYTIRVEPSLRNNLKNPSVLLVFQLRVIDKNRLGNKIGELEQHYLLQLETEMKCLLGL